MKVVLDANIIISFLISSGATISTIFDAWEKELFVLLVSDEILQEVDEVMNRFIGKKIIGPQEAISMVRRLRKDTKRIKVTSVIKISKDKKDNRYLTCAKDGKADFLVTGDSKHLIPIGKIGKTRIVSPKEFVKILNGLFYLT